jgi:hypothetical protein
MGIQASMVSAPGATVRTAAATVQAITWASPMLLPCSPACLDDGSATLAPNAGAQARLEAGARHERTLAAVACTRLLGPDSASKTQKAG